MLQPRPSRVVWLLLILAARNALTEETEELLKDEHRIKRDTTNGDVTVLSLEENGRLRDPPVGVISSTARTFVNDGATTEFATQIIGTTVGNTYARLLSTGTRVYYDGQRHTKDPFLVFPSLPGAIFPTKTPVHLHTAEPVLPQAESLNEIAEPPHTEKPEPVVSVRKEFSVKRNTEPIKPAKVKPKSDLPTVTIKNEFSPSGYSADLVEERKEEKKPRGGKGLFRGGVPVKNDFQKYDTVTYVGFADFTTTVGNTIIVFMPKTVAQVSGPVTSISGAATLRPEDVSMPVVTSVKTFLSHSPGMATKTFSDQNEKVRTSLPTIQADIRASKAYNPVFQSSEVVVMTEEPTTNSPTTTNPTTTNPPVTTNQQPTTEQTTEHVTESTTEEEPQFEPSETVILGDELQPTESLPLQPTYSTTKTQVFIPGDQPLGLAKSIAVVEAYDETTTFITSFLFGTVINGQYTQLTQIASSTSVSDIAPTSAAKFETNEATESLTPEVVTTEESEPSESTTEKEKKELPQNKPSINYITRIIPSTIYQTYTYFTTFFIPDGDKSTSVKSREVVTSEVKYITTSIPPPGYRSYSTISPTEQYTTPSQPTTESGDIASTTEEVLVEPTPHLPDTALLNPTTEDTSTESVSTTETSTTEKSNDTEKGEEEVEVIIKTLYTTYTYLTTFFQETTSSIKSREVVETNVVTTTIDSEFKATDPAVAGLLNSFSSKPFKKSDINKEEQIQPSKDIEIQPTSTEFLKTYTYFTTVFVDGETLIESHTEVVTESIQPSTASSHIQFKTVSADDNNVVPRKEANNEQSKRKPSYGTISRPKVADKPTSEALVMSPYSAALQSSIDEAYAYDTTMSRDDRIVATQAFNIPVEEVISAREEELKKEAMQAIGMTPVLSDDLVETMITDVTSSSSGGSRHPYDEYESDPNDQISSESNTEEIEPSRTPALVLQTSYTTYTYFTTVYKDSTSQVVSRLETVTNVVTETVRPTEIEAKLSPEEATLPITYFTTFTYWTTLYKGKSTHITSREETVSNVVTPTLPASLATVATVALTSAPAPLDVLGASEEIPTSTAADLAIEPTTIYTTYTYFTTSYIGNETVINSHLETETNVVTPTATPKEDEIETSTVEEIINSTTINPEQTSSSTVGSQLTGLISTIRSSEVKDGITTLYNTDVYGTFIDGLYAQVLESSTEIVAPTSTSSLSSIDEQSTGVVSINEGKIVDADGISTTLFTTKAIGTYIDNLYAQVIESTSSLIVDEEKKTATPHLPSTTVIGSKTYTTGLVRLIEGSIIKDDSTTFYESRVIGTLIDGRYAQIIESTSSFKLKMESTEMPTIKPTPTPTDSIQPTAHSPSPSSSVIESSQSVDDDENVEIDALKGKHKTKASKASIRPFASRSRPNFLPKRKDPATTITRTSFTPTVTATPASKTKGFGSSRNRFAANRSKSSSTSIVAEIKPSSSSRRFGGSRTRSSSAGGFGASRSRPSSSAVRPTISASQTRRAGFNFRSSGAVRPSISASSQRFRIRPTQALGPAKASVPPNEDINNDINQVSTEEPGESVTALEEELGTTSAPTTTESPRRAHNPLLRFRRPPILQRASTTTTTTKPTTTTKRSSLLRRPDSRAVAVTTPRSRPAVPNFTRKPRPGSNLFPPRGLLRKPVDEPEEKEEEEEEEEQDQEDEQPEIDIQDNEYEGSETSEQHSSTTTEAPKGNVRRGKGLTPISIRPFARRLSRAKRQVEYGTRSYQPKFRRNKARTTAAAVEDEYEYTPAPTRQTTSAKYHRSRGRSNYRDREDQSQQQQQTRERVRPSPVTNTPRHQFTLRERSQTTPMAQRSSYRRTTTSPRRRLDMTTTGGSRIKAPKLRSQTTEASPRTTSRRFSSSRGSTRTTSRARNRDSDLDYYSPPPFDGTITVTHRVPTEVTIPVVNGKNTEFKNVITAKPSLEVLGPYQYSTTTKDGKPIIQLTTELTSTLPNGLMEITKYLVYETPTTSVTFTPTTLRGRKTSFSHVVPSTVYEVRQEVSTIQPNLGNAPLANLILSQLLLGNLGSPNTAVPGVPQSPTTEFKTKTTTYVTTVTSHTSTILPLTFRGKEITTTIVDSSVQVITATEYITETIVTTPTAVVPAINNQLNTLLLPALLQAQLLQPPPQPQIPIAQQYLPRDPLHNHDKEIDDEPEQRFAPRDDDFEEGERKIREYDEDVAEIEQKPKKKGKIKLKAFKPPDKVQSTSVVTVYVSGKHPGEFTTLLSTILVEDSSNVKKREVNYNSYDKNDYFILPSRLPELGASEEPSQYYETLSNDILIESSEIETQSQENVVTKHLSFSTLIPQGIEETTAGHFLSQGPADSAPEQRTATTRSISIMRSKRDVDEEPKRKRIRIRVPIRRYRNETGYLPSESAHVEDFSKLPEEEGIPGLNQNYRRIQIYKKKVDHPSETPQRKRILVKKTRLIEPVEATISDFNNQYPENIPPTTPKRKKILVTRKKIVPSQTFEPGQKKRITITRKRPIPSEITQEQIQITSTEVTIFADSPVATLYNNFYSLPSETPEEHDPNVTESGDLIEETTPYEESDSLENDDDVPDDKDEETTTPAVSEEVLSYTEETMYALSPDDPQEKINPVTQPHIEAQPITSNPLDYEGSDYDDSESDDRGGKTEEEVGEEEEGREREVDSDAHNEQINERNTHALTSQYNNHTDIEAQTDTLPSTEAPTTIIEPSTVDLPEATHSASSETLNLPSQKIDEPITEMSQPTEMSPTATEDPFEDDSTPIQYHYTTRLTTTTRLRTYTYVVTRVSGTEQIVTSSTAVKPDVRTITVTDLVPISKTLTGTEEGRGYHMNLSTKRMSNGVEVIVAGKSTMPGQPHLRVLPTGSVRPITLAPSTLTDHMMMLLPQESQKPHNEFVTKTYMTTYTYLTTFAQDGSTVVSSREKVISNVVTEEIKPSKTKVNDHFTLTASPDLTTGVYHTTYTYLNTLVDGELPLVVTSKKTVSNTVTEQPTQIQPSEVPLQDTNTYLSTVAYTKTLSEGDNLQIVSTEDVLTQVVITESDFIPSAVEESYSTSDGVEPPLEITPTPITTDIVKTYYATYTYYNTKVDEDGETVVETEVVTSSDVATETFTIQPKRPKPIESSFEKTMYNPDSVETETTETQPLKLYATKTYLTTYTYFTTLLQENKTPSIVVSSSTEVMQNIVTETVNPALFDSDYLDKLRGSVNDNHEPVITTATMSDGEKMEITAMGGDMMKLTDKMDTIDATSPGNVVTGSTIIFFDDEDDQGGNQPSFSELTTQQPEHETATTPTVKEVTEQNIEQGVANNSPVKNNILQLSSLGINALGPVINAMADLFQSKLGSGKKNFTEPPQPVYKPIEEPPRPVYIPVLDSEVAESQNIEGLNVYADVHQRTKQTDRTSIEAALLSGGIPISPGQVIRTNSDVIIGKHSVHGPRPPLKPFQKEVEGMKPPPPPPSHLNKDSWPTRNQERFPSGHPPLRHPNAEKTPPRRDPSHLSKPLQSQSTPIHKPHNKNNFIDLRHEGSELKKHKPLDSTPQSSKPIDIFQKPFMNQKVPLESHSNRRPPLKERPMPPNVYPDDTTDLRPPALQVPPISSNYLKENKHPSFHPTKEIYTQQNMGSNNIKPVNNDDVYPTVPLPQPNKPDSPVGQQLLVNIQPSQVANVIIPHGVSTALIYNKEPEVPSQKGEIFSEPSPYPDAEVGIGGSAGLARPEDEILHAAVIPSNAIRMDVPVSPQGIGIDSVPKIHKDEKKKNSSHLKKPIRNPEYHYLSHGLNYMTPPPPPVSALINYHFSGKEEIPDQEGEYSLKNEYQAEDEDDLTNDSTIDYIKPGFISPNRNNGEIPLSDIQIIPSGNSEGVSFSVINSKPVILGNETLESQPPIIKGRPGVSSFVNNSEATVSVGQMTNLQPNEDLDIPSNPMYNVHSTAIIRKPQQIEKHNRTIPRPFDNTVFTMNMDERPPLQDFKAPPHKINFDLPAPVDMELMRLTPRPVFDRNSEGNVVGLTPPAISRPHEVPTLRPTRRPTPIRNRPSPPYKFEIPSTLDRVKNPILPDTERPPPPPVPTEVLSPPKQEEDFYNSNKNKQHLGDFVKITTPQPNTISPVLGGSLKVEENQQKPEVITADSKVTKSNPKIQPSINKFHRPQSSSTKISPTYVRPNTIMATHANELIVGSESVIEDHVSVSSTEALSTKTRPVHKFTGTTTKFIPTRRTTVSRFIKPTKSTQSHRSVIPLHLNPKNDSDVSESVFNKEKVHYKVENEFSEKENYPTIEFSPIAPTPTTHIVTHTQTLTVTTTESRIIQSKGQKPSTHTLIVTKTLTSTILDTITEVHTIVKPTSILSTVTTTIPQATTTVYPTVPTHYTPSPTKEIEKNPSDGDKRNHNKNHRPESTKPNNHNQKATSEMNDGDSILVVMTDKNTNHKLNNFGEGLEPAPEIEGPEVETNEIAPNVLLSGYLSHFGSQSECNPDCKATRNERCQKVNGQMRCVCRPGFARMFPDQPCKPTYTYSLSIPLERKGKEKLAHSPALNDNSSTTYQQFAEMTREGLDRMVMQSDLRDVYHGLAITGFKRDHKDGGPVANFYIQLSENFDEDKLMDILKKYLVTSNFSVGGTDLHASRAKMEFLRAEDFDECSDQRFHDCSENAQCFNLRGSYTCSCKEGFTDLSHNTLYPGRVCSADMIGCERCNYHGNCYQRSEDSEDELCECFHWYAGQYCQINLKVLLLILVLVGVSLGVLLVVCLVLSCMREKPRRVVPPGFRLRPPPPPDKRAMISIDTASEASLDPPPFIPQPPPPRVVERPKPCRKTSKAPSPPLPGGTLEQRDRSLTVMIPRAKYRPVPGSNLLTMSTFGPEQKLLKYLTPERQQPSASNSRKPSNSTNHSHESSREREAQIPKKSHSPHPRKPSTGALVSAGFEVSATVGRTKELQECFITEPHTDLGQPGFSTIRTADSSIIVDIPPPPTLEAELLDASKIDLLTVSEVRSYDETTIHPATKCLRIHYDKNDDSHTMVERDLGSTFIMPQSQLFKPARSNGSDISNFDSL